MLKKRTKLDTMMMDTGASRLALQWIMDQRVRLSRALAKGRPLFLKGVPEGKSQLIGDTILKALEAQQKDESIHLATICRLVEDLADRLNARESLRDAEPAVEPPVKPEFVDAPPEAAAAD